MEDKRAAGDFTLRRVFQGNRLEQPLLALVYEHLCPVIRGRVVARPPRPAVPKVVPELQRAIGG